MEKYKRWTDHAYGIHPFTPFQRKNTAQMNSVPRLLMRFLLGPLLFLARLPLWAVALTTAVIYNSLLDTMMPLAVVKRPLVRYLNFVFARGLLLLMGFWGIDVEQVTESGRRVNISVGDSLQKWMSGLEHGDLILANHVSYVEVLYLAMRYSPTFAAVVWCEETQQPKIVKQTFVQYLLSVMMQVSPPTENAQDLRDILQDSKKNQRGPVVLFPEGVTSNGSALLAFQTQLFDPDFGGFLKENAIRVHLFVFKFECQYFSPAYHLPGLFSHVYGMLSQGHSTLRIKFIENALDDNRKEFRLERLRETMSKTFRHKPLTRGMKDKREFMEYWHKTQQKRYVEKSQ